MKSLKFFDDIAKTKFDFVKHAWKFAILSLAIIGVGLIVWIAAGFNLGLDFTGGTIVKIQIGAELDEDGAYEEYASEITAVFEANGIKVSQMQQEDSGEDAAISVRFQDIDGYSADQMSDLIQNEITAQLTAALNPDGSNADFQVQESQRIGATASSDLLSSALLAIIISALLILIYIAIRFELLSGLATLVTIVHDVLIVCAFVAICRIEVNSGFIAALITVIGYSINNTIIIFDRVRENMNDTTLAKKGNNYIVNLSVKQTLVRSCYTTFSTLLAVALLAIIGVSSIKIFLLPIIVGTIAGAYSSILLAPALWATMLNNYTERMKLKGKTPRLSIFKKKTTKDNAKVDETEDKKENTVETTLA